MRIDCPLCGQRDMAEFTYDGDSEMAAQRPDNGALDIGKDKVTAKDLADWVDYVYLRDNPAGKHHEVWQHSAGCRQFIEIERDTKTHKIFWCRLYENGLPTDKDNKVKPDNKTVNKTANKKQGKA